MQMLVIAAVTTAILAAGMIAAAEAAERRSKAAVPAKRDRDCTPINGRYGYYGNPWCDTGSYRMGDIEFRERTARQRKPHVTR